MLYNILIKCYTCYGAMLFRCGRDIKNKRCCFNSHRKNILSKIKYQIVVDRLV